MGATDLHRSIEAVFRIESAKLIGSLTRLLGDLDLAEELAQDALVAALETWPADGVPDKPGAWLMATAKRRGIDRLRHRQMADRKQQEISREWEEQMAMSFPQPDENLDQDIDDDVLRLMFAACHPILSTEARLALTLRLLGGLSTEEIARAFLVGEATIAQRIVRAKRTLADAGLPFEVPRGAELAARLGSVLEVIYLIFNEGYSATVGDHWTRPALCEEALRLGRMLAALAPAEPEVHGLIALLEIQASRLKARVGSDGEAILLMDQNRARWDPLLIQRGLNALQRANALGRAPGSYALQAAIAACHARARSPGETDWTQIASLYAALMQIQPSAVIELNRAVAVSMAEGPAQALAIVDALAAQGALRQYHLLPSVRADLLQKLGRLDEARAGFEHAATLTRNSREQQLLRRRAADCAGQARSGH